MACLPEAPMTEGLAKHESGVSIQLCRVSGAAVGRSASAHLPLGTHSRPAMHVVY